MGDELTRGQIGWRDMVQFVWKEVKSAQFWVPFGLMALLCFWIFPACYFCLWTLTWAPGGYHLILSIAALLGFAAYGLLGVFFRIFKEKGALNFARKRARAGEPGAVEDLQVARDEFRRKVKPQIGWGALAAYATIPMFVSLALYSEMQPITYHRNGAVIVETRQGQLRATLVRLQRRGIYWPPFSGPGQ